MVIEIDISFFEVFLRFDPEHLDLMFRKVQEVCRIHFILVAPIKSFVVTSYDQKEQKTV